MRTEKKKLNEHVDYLSRNVAKLNVHISCLGCDRVKPDTLMLLCGHNICSACLSQYSKTDHPRSSIRCEVCSIETKVTNLAISLPNRAICDEMLDIKVRIDRLLNYDLVGETISKELHVKFKDLPQDGFSASL